MFSGAISVKIKSENQILEFRSKAKWFAEKIGFDKRRAGILSTIISEITRLMFSKTNSGRIEIISLHNKIKSGVTILAFLEEVERNGIEKKLYEKLLMLEQTDLGLHDAGHIVDEFKIFPGKNNDLIMQVTKWV